MIAQLVGEVVAKGVDRVLVAVGGVVLQVWVPAGTAQRLGAVGSQVRLWTHVRIRDEIPEIYGFDTEEQKRLFEILLTVSGVGPKAALGILGAISPAEFHRCVVLEDMEALTELPGIGKKTARRILAELKDRMAAGVLSASRSEVPLTAGSEWEEAVSALVALGYGRMEAARAVQRARSQAGEEVPVEELVRRALKLLGRDRMAGEG